MPRRLSKNKVIDAETRGWVRGLIRREMAHRGLTYRDLAGMLSAMGLEENEGNLRSKVTRGELSAATLLAALQQMGVKTVSIQELQGAPDPDPEHRMTIEGALRHELVTVTARNDDAGIYGVTIGKLKTRIEIVLERRTQAGDTVYNLTHTIRPDENDEFPSPSMGFDFSPARSLKRAIDQLTRVYESAVSSGLTPSEKWVRRSQYRKEIGSWTEPTGKSGA